jgi:hypothetical protein
VLGAAAANGDEPMLPVICSALPQIVMAAMGSSLNADTESGQI